MDYHDPYVSSLGSQMVITSVKSPSYQFDDALLSASSRMHDSVLRSMWVALLVTRQMPMFALLHPVERRGSDVLARCNLRFPNL